MSRKKSTILGGMIRAEIADRELAEHIGGLERDGMSVFVMADGMFRGALFHGTRFVNQLRANHKLGILETMVLGQAALCAALMIPTIKGRGRAAIRYDTNGPAAGFSVEADSAGSVRGYLLQNPIPIGHELESWDLSPFFGPGTLTVTRTAEGGKAQQTGSVEIRHRNIAQDLAWYFAQSEQVQTAFNTSIQLDKQGRVVGAGGMFLQLMPGTGGTKAASSTDAGTDTDDGLAAAVERAFTAAPSYGQWFSEKGNREDIIHGLFREFKPAVVLERGVVFDCPCSMERFTGAIRALGEDEVRDILRNDSDPLEVACHNCGSVYHIPKSSLV